MALMTVLLGGVLVALAVIALKWRAATALLQQARADAEALQKRIADLEADNKALAQYRTIPDAEKRAADIISEAERAAAALLAQARDERERMLAAGQEERARAVHEGQESRQRAAVVLSEALAKASSIISKAEQNAAEMLARTRDEQERMLTRTRDEQERMRAASQEERARAAGEAQDSRQRVAIVLADAATEASKIIESASNRAQAIASEAHEAIQKADQLKKTVDALKNVLEGYGDRYVVPTYGLLDELAEQFGYTEAGQQLKASRDRMRSMIKAGTAATCDYVEENRKTTAIDFVLDAFNGKVDTILASVKHDNHGTLAQKIQDAFTLVNHNGQAFRNARITSEYLQARLDELRWAAVAHELREKNREEQRIIKERIREEERAQREYERAMKDAQKEEELLRKAMEKAQREVEKASVEQKSRYEEQLRELQEKLKAAEEKNQRALSMAQQTKTGHVYIISNIGSFGEDVFKIGLTRRLEPLERVKELGDASVPFDFDVHALVYSEDAPALERELHKRFVHMQVNKVNPRKEFFRLNLLAIRQEMEQMGHQAQWTMTAECREYKETLAIEQSMKDKTFHEGEWLKQQQREREAVLQQATG